VERPPLPIQGGKEPSDETLPGDLTAKDSVSCKELPGNPLSGKIPMSKEGALAEWDLLNREQALRANKGVTG
jgi:hypothetical protein